MTAFVLDRPALDRLIEVYEALRARDGMGSMLFHVTPRQRIDAAHVCASVYAAGVVPAGDQRGFWLRYLRPILAETREQAALLADALNQVAPPDEPRSGAFRAKIAARLRSAGEAAGDAARRFANLRALALAGGLAIAAVVAIYAMRSQPADPGDRVAPVQTDVGRPDAAASKPASGGDARAAAYAQKLSLTMTIADQYGGVVTPYALAAGYAGAAPSLGQPSAILARMLRKVPLPPYASIPQTPFGAVALRAYAAQAAATALGDGTASFEPFLFDDGRFAGGAGPRLDAFARSGSTPSAMSPPPSETWAWWTALLPFLVLLPGAAWAFSGRDDLLREAAASMLREAGGARRAARRARAGDLGERRILRTSLGRPPALPPARQTVRALLKLREARPGLRLDAARSLRATLASAGDLVSVMRSASRAIDFVFLIRRESPHDHARARALRLVNALSDAGVAVMAYDYAQDPRVLTATSRSSTNERETPRNFDLRGLWELHADAVLVLMTDGDDLIDGIAQKPYAFVRDELRRWPRRMLLTPTPVAEWGEREMRLAFALDAPIGRSTMAGFADLGLGLSPDAPEGRPRRALKAARVETGFLARIARWSSAAATAIAPDPTPERPRPLAVGGAALLLDAASTEDERTRLLTALRVWLGPAFFWFAACGVYPQLRFDLTLWLGQRLRRYGHARNPAMFSEAALERLCLLPWFRAGFMPDWLRVAAFGALSEREQTMARAAVAELLEGRVEEADRAGAGLDVWQASWRGQALSADDVLLGLVDPEQDAPIDRASIAAEAAAEAQRRWRNRGLFRIAALAVWAALASWLWPSPTPAPHPQGAWWPLLGFVGSSALLSASLIAPWTRSLWDLIPLTVERAEARVAAPPTERERASAKG